MPLTSVHARHTAAGARFAPLAGRAMPVRHVIERMDDDAVHGPVARGLVADLADGDQPARFRAVASPVRGRTGR